MRIFGIGIDVVEVERIASAIERHGEPFLAKLFTASERSYCEAQNKPALHYAARDPSGCACIAPAVSPSLPRFPCLPL